MDINDNSFIYTKKFKITLIVISVVILISLLIYYFVKKGSSNEHYKVGFKMNNILTSNMSVFPNCEIPKPLDDVNYTINFTIFIDNFYENYGGWRHIFHKGNALDDKFLNYKYIDEMNDGWDELVADIPKQNPGLWLHPNTNNLRFAIETEYNYDYCPDSEAAPYSSINKNNGKEPIEHATKYSLQYFDIEDIPVKTEVTLTFVINNNVINMYYNGILKKVFTIKGLPILNKGPLYIHYPNTYAGELKVYEYYPKKLDDKNVYTIAK